MRIAILGNSGSGKSTLARWLAARAGAALLDLDTVAWEPHKYAARAEQDERLAFLLSWVRDYYVREDDLSLAGHRRCFEAYAGPRVEVTAQLALKPPAPELLSWLR